MRALPGKFARIAAFVPVLLLSLAGAACSADSMFLLGDACVSCHLTCERVTPEISVVAWKKSVHFRPDVTCSACHGGDRYLALPFKKGHLGLPTEAKAEASCGSCHEKELADFVYIRPRSAKNGCKAGCVSCHSYHNVQKAGPELVSTETCGACHSADKARPAIEAAAKLRENRDGLLALLSQRRQAGLPVEYYENELVSLDKKTARAFHASGMTGLATALSQGPEKEIAELSARLAGDSPAGFHAQGVFVVLLIIFALIVLAFTFRSLPKQGGKR
ncbi:MAG: hypothetical protein AB1921_07215 [Thermodesulfobacteriota bacterium]